MSMKGGDIFKSFSCMSAECVSERNYFENALISQLR